MAAPPDPEPRPTEIPAVELLESRRELARLRSWLETIAFDLSCQDLRPAARSALEGRPAPAPHPLRVSRA